MASSRRTIGFTTNHLSVRGTDVSMYDYAHDAETLLGHRSLVVSPSDADNSEHDRFADRCPVTLVDTEDDLEHLLRTERADAFYTQIHGAPQWLPSTQPRTLVHAVFQALTPFGDVYATISDWLVDHHSHGSLPVPKVAVLVRVTPRPKTCAICSARFNRNRATTTATAGGSTPKR